MADSPVRADCRAELIRGVTRHHATGTGIANGGTYAGVNLNGLNIGKARLLPPTLTFQCHFTNFGAFTASVGAGVNYTVFPNQSPGNTPNNGLTITCLKFHDTFSAAFQVGFDYMIDRHRGFNVDVKILSLRPDFDAAANNGTIPQTGTAKLDPRLKGA